MASIGGVSGSNSVSSLMNSANMISGLASGLDTEGMIENLVKGYQAKIDQLNQKITKTEWKQDSYRGIITKMVGFSEKYTSYTSSANLMSPSFFNNAVKAIAKGEFADSVSASGRTDSDIRLNAVHQLATASQYRTAGNLNFGDGKSIQGSEVDLFHDITKQSKLTGSLTLTYGSKTVSVNFDESATVKELEDIKDKLVADGKSATSTDVLAGYINKKLADEKIVFNSGESESADKRIKAVAEGDSIRFDELGGGGNGVYVSGAAGTVKDLLGLTDEALKNAKDEHPTLVLDQDLRGDNGLIREKDTVDYLAEKSGATMNMSLDGVTKTITMPKVEKVTGATDSSPAVYKINGEEVQEDQFAEKYTEALRESVNNAFGGKVTVENTGTDGKLALKFSVGENSGSDLVINADIGNSLGIGSTATSYLNTSKTLGELGVKFDGLTPDSDGKYEFKINDVTIGKYDKDTKLSELMGDINGNEDAGVRVSYSRTTGNFTFTAKDTGADNNVEIGNGLAAAMFGTDTTQKSKDYFGLTNDLKDQKVQLSVKDKDGNSIQAVDFTFKRNDSTVDGMLKQFNKQLDAGDTGLKASMSATGALILTDKDGKQVDYTATGSGELAAKLSTNKIDTGYTAGQDAIFTATINGEEKYMQRSSNSVTLDGLTINMEETFNTKTDADGNPVKTGGVYGVDQDNKAVTFQRKTDSDKIVDVIKEMASDYNTMMSEIKSAYGTMPYRKSDGSLGSYEPLTDDERSDMSESAIERYEEKAKQGILFGDQNLSNLYSKMSEAFSFSNTKDVDALKDMGISLSFDLSTGSQSLMVDEDKLRSMLDSDPDKVADIFTKPDGVMDRMKNTLDTYAKVTGEPKGILVQQSGSGLSSLSLLNNRWQTEIDNYNTQIGNWQDKLASQTEKYISQFSRLEQLINQMNSQSSTLQGMMGG